VPGQARRPDGASAPDFRAVAIFPEICKFKEGFMKIEMDGSLVRMILKQTGKGRGEQVVDGAHRLRPV
jgi:hypothetical protein